MSTTTWVFSSNGSTYVQRLDMRGLGTNPTPSLQTVSPVSPNPLVLSLAADPADPGVYLLTISGGDIGLDYACPIHVQTNEGLQICLVAVSVSDAVADLVDYATVVPEAYTDLVGQIDPGQTAIGTGIFSFGTDVDPTGGAISWELLDRDGRIWSAGSAYSYSVQSSGFSVTAIGQALVTVPSDLPPSLEGQGYQLRWTLEVDGVRYYSFEQLQVTGQLTVPLGAEPCTELVGVTARPQLVTSKLWSTVLLEVWDDQQKIGSSVIAAPGLPYQPLKNSSGWTYTAAIDTSQLVMNYMKPWTLIWRFWDAEDNQMSESTELWVINPVVAQAVSDMRQKINKARTTIYGAPDLLFPVSTILTWLRRAADSFNTWAGVLTYITFTNPSGPIREYWLMIAELLALESQYLAEGEKAFDFQGAAISLSVDKTQYLDSMASKIQSRLDNELKPFKINLIYKGNEKGDGSGDPSRLQRGAMGSVGISIHPATPWYSSMGPTARPINIFPKVL